jgi:hypothetical protein
MDEERKESRELVGRSWNEGSRDIEWDQVCFVRALNQPEQIRMTTGKGGVREAYLPVLAELSQGDIPKNTSHWTINHKVGSHALGEWMVPAAVVISPSREMIARNGLPENLNAVDTFWVGGVSVPKGSVVVVCDEEVEIDEAISGVEIVKVNLNKEKMDYLRVLKGKLQDSPEAEDEYFARGQELEEEVTERVERIVSKMGFTVTNRDQGNYMDEVGLDGAIRALGIRSGIRSCLVEQDTIWGQIEGDLATPRLIPLQVADFETVNQADGTTGFSRKLQRAESVFDYFGIETPAERDLKLVFGAELYYLICQNGPRISSQVNLTALARFLKKNPDTYQHMSRWATSDREHGAVVRTILFNAAVYVED